MNKNILQRFIGAIFPISITRANLQASVLVNFQIERHGCCVHEDSAPVTRNVS